jgi:cell division protein FtsL
MNKRGTDAERSILMQIIFIAIVLALFMISVGNKINARGVRQDIVENQVATLIEAAVPGFSFEIAKLNSNGVVNDLKLEDGRVYAEVDDLKSVDGRAYFSQYNVELIEEPSKYRVVIS